MVPRRPTKVFSVEAQPAEKMTGVVKELRCSAGAFHRGRDTCPTGTVKSFILQPVHTYLSRADLHYCLRIQFR